MTSDKVKTGLIVVLTAFFAIGLTATPAAAANTVVNHSATATQTPTLDGDVTVSTMDMGWDEAPSVIPYEDDSGEVTTFLGDINESYNNTYEFTVTDINATDFGEFPHDKEDVSALDSGEWSGSATASDVETAPGVEAVELDFSGNDDIQFSNFSVTSDENKRFLQVGLDATTVNSATVLEFRVVDDDGDYYVAEFNASESSGEDFIGNSTGEGYFFQRQLGEMSLVTDGGGTFDDIQEVNVTETGGAATTVEVMALNVEKTSPYTLGEEKVDTDDDDELETETIEEVKTGGDIDIHDMSTMGTTFDSAEVNDVTMPFIVETEDLDEEDVKADYNDASNFPNFDQRVDLYFRMEVPDAYDLSYANLELKDTADVPGSRFQTVEYQEASGTTDFTDIDFDTTLTSSYDSLDADVTIDSSISPGEALTIHFDYVITDEEAENMQAAEGAVGPVEDDEGGLIDWLIGLPGMVIAAATGVFGRMRDWW